MNDYNLGDVRYVLDHDKRILYVERHDNITKEGVYAEWHAMQQLDGFDASYDAVVDYSFVTSVDLDLTDIKELNSEMPNHDPRTGNVAIVSGIKHGRYLLAQFFCRITNIAKSRKHQVFNSKAEAESWLYSLRTNK